MKLMARIRTVKPELFKHEELFELEKTSKLPIRISFIGLFTCCDREGRFKWRPRSLKLDVIPYDDCDFSRVLDALMTRGFVVKYEVNGEEFGHIPSFNKHQVINNRESESELPNPSTGLILDASSTREARDDHAPLGERKGKEGKEYDETSFLEFWYAYPKKTSKPDALKAWKKIAPDDELKAKIIDAVNVAKQSKDWTKDEGQFIPYPATWLNAKRWEDVTVATSPVKREWQEGERNGDLIYEKYIGWRKLNRIELLAEQKAKEAAGKNNAGN